MARTHRTAAQFNAPPEPETALWRLPEVLAQTSLGRSTFLAGVKAGRYPQPIRLSQRRVAWRSSDIRAMVASIQ